MSSLPSNMPPRSGVYSILNDSSSSSPPAVEQKPPTRKSASLFSLSNKTALITGGGRGMGLEIAVAYAEAGAVVYCLDLAETPKDAWVKCRDWVETLPELPGSSATSKSVGQTPTRKARLEYAQCDVSQCKATQELIDRIAEKEGGIDVCVVSAGIVLGGNFLDCDEENLEKHMKVNFHGALFTTQAVARQMVKRGTKGSIVLIASIGGSVAIRMTDCTAYNASKAAILQLSRSIACELGPKGIRCNAISPGVVMSDMTKGIFEAGPDFLASLVAQNPLGRVAYLEEVRGAALFLGSDASSFCTGSNLMLDGGHTAW